MRQIVIMPGGFHPFHAGHAELYKSAVKAFNNADVYVAATNDTKTRPFPFAIKEKLAKLAGVADKHFIQVKSPFKSEEITSHYNPNEDVLIFVRSEKDKTEQPKPGGTKKDGSPSYFQPYTGKNLQPFSKHAYIAYLPTVEFGPGITSATEIRNAWPKLDDRRKTAMVMSLYPVTQKNPKLAANVVKMLDMGMGEQVDEGWKDVVASGAMALSALGAGAQTMPNINAQQVELANKYYNVLVQRAKEDGIKLDTRTLNAIKAKATDAAAQKFQQNTPQQNTFPSQGSERKVSKDIGQFESQGVAEGKIKLSTDPNWYGAEVGDYKASGPIVNIPTNRLVGFEPDDKMNQPASKANVQKIVAGLKQGAKLPPLMVRQYKNGYQVLDGHHRFWAYKLLDVKSIPAQVVPAEDIEEITKQGVAEGSGNNNVIAQKIFFARSKIAPKAWSYDHVGFITQDGKQIQMSGHKGNDVYITNDVTDDPEFPQQQIKVVSLPKPVNVPTSNSVGAENCGTFVANVLQANGFKGFDTEKLYRVFKKPKQQGVAEDYEDDEEHQGTTEHYNGIEISLEVDNDEVMVKAMMANGREMGHVLFVQEGDYLMPQDLEVEERYQGQGIAATMYDYVKSKGYKIRRSGQQTDAGAGFWDKHRPEQNVWEQELDEGPFVQRITNPKKVNIYLRLGKGSKLVATDIPYEILDKYINKVIQKYPQFKPDDFSFAQTDKINEFALPGGDDREPDEEEILRQLASQWWLGTAQQMAKAQRTLHAMGWEIGQDESGDDDAGVFVIRAGDENGNSYIAFPHSALYLDDINEDYLEEN